MHRSQLRAIQKRLRRTDRSCDRRKNAPREPNGVASDRKHAASGAKILPADRNGVARNANALGTTQKCCDRPRRNCSRRKKSSREPKRVARDRKTLGTAQKFCPRTEGGCPQRKCVAIDAKMVATDRSQLRSTQKRAPRTKRSCPRLKTRRERCKHTSGALKAAANR